MASKKKKISIAVVYGGVSGEHEVSLQSAASVMAELDPAKYEVVPVLVEKSGQWRVAPPAVRGGAGKTKGGERMLAPTAAGGALISAEGRPAERIDVVFPLVHGTGGEDGAIQGLLELAGIPYVGSGVLGSAIGMDKIMQKKVLEREGLPVAPYVHFRAAEWRTGRKAIVEGIERELGYPCFVKPANLGSSVGISKAHHRRELVAGIDDALRYDDKALVERAVPKAREIECGVIGDDEPRTSVLGEIVPSNEFYDYEAKYISGSSRTIIPADLPKAASDRIRAMAARVFKVLDASGFARVDFFVDPASGQAYVNEINTIPGFTKYSMFPVLWQATGMSYGEVLDELVRLALARAERRRALVRTFRPPAKKGGKAA